jgi:hypothetical protein
MRRLPPGTDAARQASTFALALNYDADVVAEGRIWQACWLSKLLLARNI